MDTQTVLDTALAANATSLGAPEAASIFKQQLKSAVKVSVNLLPGQKAAIQKMVDYPLVFVGGKTVTNDHPVLVACRDITRNIFEQDFQILNTSERTLIVGASAREIRQYNSNPHIHYYVHGRESKDYDRIIRPALQDLCKLLKKKASKTNFTVFLPPEEHPESTKARPVVKRYWKMEEVLRDYQTSHRLPETIHLEYVEANTLVFEDSFYNFSADDYVKIFLETGAQIAYGYGLLPWELLFPDMPSNHMYTVRQEGSKTTLVFRQGFCNGYSHDTDSWKTLLRSPILTECYHRISLAVEITARVGPMAIFKIFRVSNPETIVRNLELPDRQQYVRVLDVRASIDRRTGRTSKPLNYFSVNENEYLDVYNYVISLDKKSVSFQNIVAYIRRRMGGMSLITRELVEPWFLEKRRVQDLALTVLLEVKVRTEDRELAIENINVGSISEKFLNALRLIGRTAFFPIALLMDWIYSGHLVDKLVLYPDNSSYQLASVKIPEEGEEVLAGLYLDNPYEGDIPNCSVCLDLLGKLGKQEVRCDCKDISITELSLSDDELKALKTSLIDTDEDAPGLASVKKRCLTNLPVCGFKRKVKVHYIRAGPGCGKSYLIRVLAEPRDLVLAPFTKLKADYEDLIDENGERYDLVFKTTHRAMETRGCKRIFVDEFTSMPYEYLACIAEMNGAEEVYLVGDELQTKVQEPTEGIYIGNRIDLSKVSTHELLVNFRNPQDTVALLNKVFNYKMRANSNIEKSIEIVQANDFTMPSAARVMCFTKASSQLYTESDKNTVRSNQGGTTKTAVLYVTHADGTLPSIEELQIVALSRHTEKLYIVVDGCEQAKILQAKIDLSPEFYDHMQTWLQFPREDTIEIVREDKVVELVTKPVQPPRDMYLMASTFLPSAAFDDQTTSLNHLTSALVPEEFNSGKFDLDLVIAPVNRRRHPMNTTMVYYSASSGIGNHFSSKSPIQTLQVLQARYLNKVRTFKKDRDSELLAAKIVNLWFDEHVNLSNIRGSLMDDAEISAVIQGFIAHVTQKSYQNSFSANGGLDNNDGRVIRFNLKGIFKPKFGEPDVMKAGQGISAWSTDACAMFCSVFRILNKLSLKSEKPHVVTDAYKTEPEFIALVKTEMDKIPAVALNATTDGIQFDANQNWWTQLIEKLYWTKLGVSSDFIDHYYSFRNNYAIISPVAMGFAKTQKTSGEPGTLPNNGIVSKCISNFIVRGDGPMQIVYKGDDFNKRQCNLRKDEENLLRVNAVCDLGLRVSIGRNSEFCGLTFCEGNLFPSIPRKINKVLAHRFRDYGHFCEYQISLRDWINQITKYGEMEVICCNAAQYQTSSDEMTACLDTIKSISHLNKEQFFEQFLRREEQGVIPTVSKFGGINMVLG